MNVDEQILKLYNSGLILIAIQPLPNGSASKGPRFDGWNRQRSSENPGGYTFNSDELPRGKNFNYGLLHSESHTIAFDLDDLSVCKKLFSDIAELDIDALLSAHDRFQIKSPKNNRGKLIYKLPVGVSIDTVKKYSVKKNGKLESIFELRSGPNQDIIIGTHPEGGDYEIIGDPSNIPEIPACLLDMAQHWQSWKPVFDSFFGIATQPKNGHKEHKEYKNDGVKAFNDKFTAREIIERNGYTPVGEKRYRRPGSTSVDAPPIVVYDDGKVFSFGIDELADEHSHDAFSCFKILECGGDFKKAIKWNNDSFVEVAQVIDTVVDREWMNADDMADNATAPVYLIDDIIESKTHGLIAGSSQSFKSFCVLKMAHSICTGNDFFGNDVFDTGKVLYICGEGIGALGRRIKALKIVEGGFNNNFFVLSKPLFIDNIAEMEWLREQINKINPVLVVFDTFSSLATSTQENVNDEVARVLRMVSDCCIDSGASSIVVHHYGKDSEKGTRGASAFGGNVDFELSMKRVPDTMCAVIGCKKTKDGDYFKEIEITAHIVDLGLIRQNGKSTTSLILKSGNGLEALTDRQQTAYDGIRDLVSMAGFEYEDKLCVSESMIKSLFNDMFIHEGKNRYGIFARVIPSLLKKGILHVSNAHYWL